MSIYTKTGDKGETSMFEPDIQKRNRISKADLRVEAIGAVDELNSYLGIANYYSKNVETVKFVKEVQNNLFTIGAILSFAPLKLPKDATSKMEHVIDELEENLPPLRNFLMPEGSEPAVHFMYSRALARKAERQVVALHNREGVGKDILEYINRISDYLFCIFRDENLRAREDAQLWIGKKN